MLEEMSFFLLKNKINQTRKTPNLAVKKFLPSTEIFSGEAQRSLLSPSTMKMVSLECLPAGWEQHCIDFGTPPPPPWVFLKSSHIRIANVTSAGPKNTSENAESVLLGPLSVADKQSLSQQVPVLQRPPA